GPQDHVADPRPRPPPSRLLVTSYLLPVTSMPRAVITGAAGFIGSHLSETLLDRGWTVVGIDNLLTGSVDNIAHLAGRDFTFVKHDVTNYIYVEGHVDVVFHW